MRGWSQCSLITAGSVDHPGALLPEVDLLLRRSNHQRDVTVLLLLLPHLEGRGFQNITIHHRHRPHKAPGNREVAHLSSSPGRVLLPGDGLGQTTVRGFSFWTDDSAHQPSSGEIRSWSPLRIYIFGNIHKVNVCIKRNTFFKKCLENQGGILKCSRSLNVSRHLKCITTTKTPPPCPPAGVPYLQHLLDGQTSQAGAVSAARLLQKHPVVCLGLLQAGVEDVRAAHVHRCPEETLGLG